MFSGFGEYEEGEDGQLHRTSGRNSRAKGFYNENSDEENDNSSDFQDFDDDEDDDFNGEIVKSSKKKAKQSKPKSTSQTKRAPRKNYDKMFIDDAEIYEEKGPRKRKKVSYDYSTEESDDAGWDEESYSSEDDAGLAYSREPRRTKSVSYFEEEDEIESDSESEDEEEKKVEKPQGPRIKRIIGIPSKQTDPPKYFVKMANESYRHCKWLNEEEILALNGRNLLNMFKRTVQQVGLKQMIECDSIDMLMLPDKIGYSTDFCEIDRIIAKNEEGKYLVLWKGLDYDEATWEDDVDDNEAIAEFERHNDISEYENRPAAPIPRPENFKVFGDDYPLPDFPPGRELRDYQIEGINWLRHNWYYRRSCILADEMGLGKTVQGVNIIFDLYRIGDRGPFLVVAPLSVLDQWVREFKNWTPLNVVKFNGPGKDTMAKYELTYPNSDIPKFNVILTNKDILIKSEEIFMRFNWHYVIVDEAHDYKNDETKGYKFIESLQKQNLLLMTGTPIQNNVRELWALLHLIDPVHFDSIEDFTNEYDTDKNPENVTKLQEVLRPYMLRRKKADVEKSIGKKEETIVNVELTRSQKMLYRSLIEQKIPELASTGNRGRVLPELPNLAMQLRKVCCHPFLIQDYESIIGDVIQDKTEEERLVMCSGKMVFVDKLLGKLHPMGKKVLIFSQFKKVLDLLAQFLEIRGYKYERIDGGSHGNDRQAKMDRFNDPNQDIFVFLLSTRAGGLGLNLTAADTVIIFDSDWNPQNDVQAQARCHRIGQTAEKVVVYRLITRDTYESEMFDRASKKLGLDQAILDRNASNETESKMDKKELELLIKRGAYYQLKDESYEESDNFTNQTIEQILDSRTRIFSSNAADSNSTFSKTNFNAEKDAATGLDPNDPNFWKLINPTGTTQVYNSEIYVTKRKRSNTKRLYDDGDEDDDITDWSINKVQKCLTALRTYGYNHWGPICNSTGLDLNTAKDGCSILLTKIFAGREKQMLKIAGENFALNDNQKRLANSVKTFNNKEIKAKLQQPDKIIHALQQLHAIQLFEEGYANIDDIKDSNDWDSSRDKALLHAVWANGVGKWDTVLKDPKYFQSGFLNEENKKAAVKRYKKLIDFIEAQISGKPLPQDRSSRSHHEKPPPKPRVDPAYEKLFKYLMKMGMPHESKIPKIKESTKIEDIENQIKRIFKAAARIADGKPIKDTDKDIEPLLSRHIAEQLNNNRKWMVQFKHFFKHEFNGHLDALKNVPQNQSYVPPFWNSVEHDYPLFKSIYFHGFYHLESISKKEPFNKLAPGDLSLLNHFLKNDVDVKKHAEYIMHFYKKQDDSSQPILLDEADREILLPKVCEETTIESLGNGKFFLFKGLLCREGYSSQVNVEGKKFECEILDGKKFSVNKNAASSIDEAFKAAGFKGSAKLFGISRPVVMYWNQKVMQKEGIDVSGYKRKKFKLQ